MVFLTILVPDELASSDKHQLETQSREALIVKLYEQGKISSGYAAEILGIPRRVFVHLLGAYGVSIFEPAIDVAAEVSFE